MSFEIRNRDLAARIGKLRTRRGVIETPLLLPVVNPTLQPISPKEMERDFGCKAIIANAYLLKKNHEKAILAKGVHNFLGFEGTIVTDSGGYQILVYGDVDVSPAEIVCFQEEIETDVAVILDIPTGWDVKRRRAEYTVDETLKRARAALTMLTRRDILWVGPVQGGNHLDLVSYSAAEIGKMPFDIYALGSPTQVVEQYRFDVLIDMIVTAKENLPPEKPFHLFGAGHPFMLSFAVATGCDIFDSAAYALYARREKYLTTYGTVSLRDLQYFPCACKICSKYTPQELSEMPSKEMEHLLAWHNLNLCFAEIRRVKQAIDHGRLWEQLEIRAKSHPSLFQAFKRLEKYSSYLEAGTPTSKRKGLLYFNSSGLMRPEIARHREKMRSWHPSTTPDILVLAPQPSSKPFHRSKEYKQIVDRLSKKLGKNLERISICTYTSPYGLIPLELDETYPLSQFEAAHPPDIETVDYVAEQVQNYLQNWEKRFRAVVLHSGPPLGEKIEEVCKKAVGLEKLIICPKEGKMWSMKSINTVVDAIYKAFKAQRNPSRADTSKL